MPARALPSVGARLDLAARCEAAALESIDLGYRRLEIVGDRCVLAVSRALAKAGLPRGDFFLVVRGKAEAVSSVEMARRVRKQLWLLGARRVDLYLLEGRTGAPWGQAWGVLEALRRRGRIGALGAGDMTAGALSELLGAKWGDGKAVKDALQVAHGDLALGDPSTEGSP